MYISIPIILKRVFEHIIKIKKTLKTIGYRHEHVFGIESFFILPKNICYFQCTCCSAVSYSTPPPNLRRLAALAGFGRLGKFAIFCTIRFTCLARALGCFCGWCCWCCCCSCCCCSCCRCCCGCCIKNFDSSFTRCSNLNLPRFSLLSSCFLPFWPVMFRFKVYNCP